MSALPKPGIHRGVADAEYHSWNLCSSTRLRILDSLTPKHLKIELERPSTDSTESLVGTAAHTLVFQSRQVLDTMFAIGGPINDKTGKEYGRETKAFEEWLAKQGKDQVLKQDELNRALAIAYAVNSHPFAGPAIEMCKDRELSVIADVDGTRCKGRIDGYGGGMIVDLKTTAMGISIDDFERMLANRGYGLQAALYRLLCELVGLPVSDIVFIVAESCPPHCVRVFRLKDDVIAHYDAMLPRLMAQYTECVTTNVWPGYPVEVVEIGVPAWFGRKLEAKAEQAVSLV